MMKYLLNGCIGLFLSCTLQAQLITADPPFPTDQDEVIITFNAQEGNGGLAGYNGNVYAHTGVITNNSSSGSDWKYVKAGWGENIPDCKMVSVGQDLWQLSIDPSIRSYYGVPANENILQMAFVFRSATQVGGVWLEGKTENGGDIYYDVSGGGLAVNITLPEQRPVIAQLNDVIHVEGNSNLADSTFLFLDGQAIYADTGNTFMSDIVVENEGKHWIKAQAVSGAEIAVDSFYYYVRPDLVVEDVPAGIIDGINYINDETVTLCLYAPDKQYAFVIGDFGNWELDDAYYMKRSGDGSRYWLTLSGLEPGKEYIYQYFIDGTLRVGDSYCDKVSDPWNDQWIDASTYPNLISYPEGKTTGIASIFQTAQEPYQWEVPQFVPPETAKLVIYELLIRDFTDAHTFNSLLTKLDYLQNLGVNAVELMPPSEFEGNSSWGYNPNYYFAPDKYYGPKNTFKAFIDACHKRGIAVIQDMVLNHAYGTNPMVMMYWDAANNRPAANNPWFHAVSPNPVYNWGNDFNHESPDTKAFVDRVNRYWMEEYKVDGFRFDFTKGFTNTPGDGGGFDQSRINILKRMADSIWAFKSDALVVLEHFATNSEEKILADYGMLIWGNINGNYNEATMGYHDNNKSNFYRVSYKVRQYNDPHLVGYMESHDEERLAYKNISFGAVNGNYNIKDTITSLRRNEAAAAFFLSVPGPKMIWQFGELGYDYSINYCEDGSINDACRVSPKPIRWDYFENNNRKRLYQVYAALNHLRNTEDAFQTDDFVLLVNPAMKKIQLNHPDMDVNIIGNFDVAEGSINPGFQQTGMWYDFFSGDSLNVDLVSEPVMLKAGEYRIYTTKKLQKPDIVGFSDAYTQANLMDIKLFPNPASTYITVCIDAPKNIAASIYITDLNGKSVSSLFNGPLDKGRHDLHVNVQSLQKGLYVLCVDTEGQRICRKFLQL